jgi:murein DD-endopeptidase / murein LD-carboxypeptidase
MPVDPRGLLGVPFRLHGRDPVYGLDCVGLVSLVTGVPAPTGYRLRTTRTDWCASLLDQHFSVTMRPDVGDVALVQAGPANLHLGVWMGESLIHADARIGRVVETPMPLPWPILGIWTRKQKGCAPWQR